MSTPGPSFVWDTQPLVSGFVWGITRGHGVTAAEVPTGFDEDALLLNDIDVNDPAGTEYRLQILTGNASPYQQIYEDSSHSLVGAPDGVYSGTQRVFKNGVAAYDTTYSYEVGSVQTVRAADGRCSGSASVSAITNTIIPTSGSCIGRATVMGYATGGLTGINAKDKLEISLLPNPFEIELI